MKQTAVEWLIDELHRRLSIIKSEPNGDVRETMIDNFLIDFEQAKQMEKEQIIKSYKEGHYHLEHDSFNPEQYYNETYDEFFVHREQNEC
jgi:hypothetical protein